MKEVEVKAKIVNEGVIMRKLHSLRFEFSTPIIQHDSIYLHNSLSSYDNIVPGTNVLRIRKQQCKIKFTLKKAVENELSCIEHEIELNDANQMKKMLEYLNYKCMVEVKKIRKKAYLNGITICVDNVEGLGSFIEVEKITEDEESKNVQEELFLFLVSLGVLPEDRVLQGYDTMMYYKNQN